MIALTIWQGARWKVLTLTLSLLTTGLVSMFTRGLFWAGSWRQGLDWATSSVLLVGPLTAGLAAWEYSRMRQATFAELASTTTRAQRGWLSPALLLWMQGCVAVTVCIGVAVGTTLAVGVPVDVLDLRIVPQALAVLAANVAIGACFGSMTARAWVAPPMVVLGYTLAVASSWGLIPGIFDTGGVTGSLSGEEFNDPVLLLEGIAALGIASAATLVVLSALADRSWLTLVPLTAVVGLGFLAYVALDQVGHERYRYSTTPIRYACAGAAPEVCLGRDTPRPLKALEKEFARQAAILRPLGFIEPDRFVQWVPGIQHRDDEGVIDFYDNWETRAEANPRYVSMSLGTPRECPEYSADRPNETVLDVHFVVSEWIANRTGADRVDPDTPYGRWINSDRGLAWARKAYDRLASCDFEGISAPPIESW